VRAAKSGQGINQLYNGLDFCKKKHPSQKTESDQGYMKNKRF
jgi:hypothetical protein